jgi:septal ring factor EnvC (AmiA/AmiB activator)
MEDKATEKFLGEVDKYSTNDEVYQIYTEYSREEMERNTANINLELKRQEVEQKTQEVKQYEQDVKNYEQDVKNHEQEVIRREQELDKAKDNLVNQGIKTKQIEVVRKAFSERLTIEMISTITDLSIEEVESILNSLKIDKKQD